MDRTDIQQLFQQFAAPLVQYVVLGGRQEAAETLARNLWLAMLAGPEAEEQLWRALREAADADIGLLESVRQCYVDQMKPAVGRQQLDDLRRHYQIGGGEDDEAGGDDETARDLSLACRWEIVSVEGYDAGDLHAETGAFLEFRATGEGDFHFGYVRGSMEYRVCGRDGWPAAELSFDGHDGAEPLCGSGWAVLLDDRLEVTLYFHTGREAKLEARKGGKK